jgi:hypothetical protein
MPDSSPPQGAGPPAPSQTFSELTKEIARRNEEAHKAARALRASSGKLAREQIRARELR